MQKLNLSKIQQCDQHWDFMEPQACGRLCQKCDKLIVDFRQMKDEEVAAVHMFSEGPVCGIYRKDQLQAPQKAKPKKKNWKALYLASIGLLFAKAGTAQMVGNKEKIEQNDQVFQRDTLPVTLGEAHGGKMTKDSFWVTGKVMDGEDSDPLIGVSVIILGTKTGTVSDLNGRYLLNVTDHISSKDSLNLQYSYTGFNNVNRSIDLSHFATTDTLEIDIQISADWENFQHIAFGVVRAPWHVRAWNNVKHFFRFEWLKKD